MLLLEDDEDITAGLRSTVAAVQAIRMNWQSPDAAAEKSRKAALKKLSPAQKQQLNQQLHIFTDKVLADIGGQPPLDTLLATIDTTQEAVAAFTVFSGLGHAEVGKVQSIGRLFINAAVQRGDIDPARASELTHVIQSDAMTPIGPKTVEFFADPNHASFFKKVLAINDNELTIDSAAGAQLLNKKIEAMTGETEARKPEAIALTVYGLQRIRLNYMRVVKALDAKSKSRPGKETSPAAPAKPAGGVAG